MLASESTKEIVEMSLLRDKDIVFSVVKLKVESALKEWNNESYQKKRRFNGTSQC